MPSYTYAEARPTNPWMYQRLEEEGSRLQRIRPTKETEPGKVGVG